MITPADVLDVMTVITAYHHRTAPRQDDEAAAYATAKLWADLFERHDFTPAELVAAVKLRADTCADAPEPADIIRVARTTRNDQMAREEPTHYRGTLAPHPHDEFVAPDTADYPDHWTPEQRVAAYWYALRLKALPRTTAGWQAIAEQLNEHLEERGNSGDTQKARKGP